MDKKKRRIVSALIVCFMMWLLFLYAGSIDRMSCQVTIRVNGKELSSYDKLSVKLYKGKKQQKVKVTSAKEHVDINWDLDLDKYFLKLQIPLQEEMANVPDMNAVMEYYHFPDGMSTDIHWDINYVQKNNKWVVEHIFKMKEGFRKEITDTYEYKPDEKQFLYYGV